MTMERRKLGATGIEITPIALGCWPISGMTSIGVNDHDSLATIKACFDAGINFLDTAYCYGPNGESERLIAQALGKRRDEMVIATKGGIHWDENLDRVFDASPERLRFELDESLRRLKTDRVELLYLHAPDPNVPIAESAGALKTLLDEGKTRSVGVSNCTIEQLEAFAKVCPLSAFQPHYNMLQREIELDTLPWCREHQVALIVYWPLMKGLLAGRLTRDHVFPDGDGRAKYPMFQGEEFQKNLDFVEKLRAIARETGHSVAQLVTNWTIHRPGITAALCGGKRSAQLLENAQGAGWHLSLDPLARIDEAIAERGTPASRAAV